MWFFSITPFLSHFFCNAFSVMLFLSCFFCHAFSVMLFLSCFFCHAFSIMLFLLGFFCHACSVMFCEMLFVSLSYLSLQVTGHDRWTITTGDWLWQVTSNERWPVMIGDRSLSPKKFPSYCKSMEVFVLVKTQDIIEFNVTFHLILCVD